VKSFRVWLLVLLALLLPIRGALAGAMHCPVAASGVQLESQLGAHAHDRGHHATHDGHEHAQQHPASDQHHADAAGADKCNLCSAFCSVPGLVSSGLVLGTPQLAATAFPALHAPPTSFELAGQERPPRSI
jgi:hypothetical protein